MGRRPAPASNGGIRPRPHCRQFAADRLQRLPRRPGVVFPVTRPDCTGGTVTFDSPPQRIVTLDAYVAEFVIALGFGDRIVGTGFPYPDNQIPPEMKDAYAAIPLLAGGMAGDDAIGQRRLEFDATASETQ